MLDRSSPVVDEGTGRRRASRSLKRFRPVLVRQRTYPEPAAVTRPFGPICLRRRHVSEEMSAAADTFGPMQRVVLDNLRQGSLLAAVGSASYSRGAAYARKGAVADMWWDDTRCTLSGTVLGSSDEPYTTAVYLSPADGGPREFEYAQCTCPVGVNCKHAVALVLTAAAPSTAAALATATTPPALTRAATSPVRSTKPGKGQNATPASPSPARPAVAWARSLESLLLPSRAATPAQTPLAIELTLDLSAPAYSRHPRAPEQRAQQVKVTARLVQPGRNGRWVGGDLSWRHLDSLQFYGGYCPEHVRLLREMYAVYHLGGSYQGYYHGYGDERRIDLTAFESPQLWPLLDEARAAGLPLVQPRQPGPVQPYRRAELCLDVSKDDSGSLVVTPVVRVTEPDAYVVPLSFIGSGGHGLVYATIEDTERDEPANWPLQLARLSRPVPANLQEMALRGRALEIPADGEGAFRETYYPRLRHAAAVISTDGSFTPPRITGPALLLRAAYSAGHEVDLSWEWTYQVGDSRVTAPLDSVTALDGYRDTGAERNALTALDLPLDRFGLLEPGASAGQPPVLAPRPRLRGTDTMRFSTELLPLLKSQPGVEVEVSGEPADYREAGDSLRIGVSAGEIKGDTDWFDLGISITVEGREVPFLDVFTALARGESHLLLDDGAYFSLGKPELQGLARLIEEARALQDAPAGELRISRFQAGLWDELTELGMVSHQASAWQRQVQGLLSLGAEGPGTTESVQPPAGLRAELRPYQLQGFQWLAFLWRNQLGGILADDMGLGKTLQALALIAHTRETAAGKTAPFLIVAPASVVPNWAAEAARFTPGLRVVTITETACRSGRDLGELIAGADAVVTSYTLLRLDFDGYSAADWSGLILDEAQFAKNHQSKIYQCARRLPAPFKLAVTGTPMENNLMELWSLLSITAPGLFPSPVRFRDYYARPIERQGQDELLAQLRRRIRPLLRRRTKEQVAADLPAKQEQVLQVDLHPRHRKLYQTRLQRERQKLLGLIEDMNANRFMILRSLTLLRQLSLHAALAGEDDDVPCAKIDTLLDHLREVTGGGHKALVFSQFTGFLAHVRSALDDAGIGYCYLDGKTRDRASVVARFQGGGAPVFLISLKAGGFGLNLTEADYCFLLDPWWNPATEAQAVDRTHRIGQTRNVMVYRLISSGTIEEKVMALKERKARLFADVVNGDQDGFSSAVTADDIRALLG
jgi:superfamily II DNA or RNA helicase